MIKFAWVAIFCFCSLAFAQQGQNPVTPQGMPQQSPPPNPQQGMPEMQMPGGANGMPSLPGGNPGVPNGIAPMGLPPTPEEVMTKPAEGLSARDPFRLPEELIIKLRQKNASNMSASSSGGIDPTVEAIRRFPLASYQLVGIIWDVKKPKAMFMDLSRSIHVVQVNDFIGNAKGVITSIQSGAVTVLEGKIPQIIKLKK